MQQSNDTGEKQLPIAPGWLESLAIVILFASMLGLGGFVWWPFLVGAVLLVCLACWYYHHIREVQ